MQFRGALISPNALKTKNKSPLTAESVVWFLSLRRRSHGRHTSIKGIANMVLQINSFVFEGHPRSYFFVHLPRLFEVFWSPRTGEWQFDWMTAKAVEARKAGGATRTEEEEVEV